MKKLKLIITIMLVVLGLTLVIAQSEDDATLIIGSSGAVLRETPAKEGDMISWVDGRIPILGFNPDEKYYFVEVEGQQGWISIGYGRVEGDLTSVPIIAPEIIVGTSTSIFELPDNTSVIISEVEPDDVLVIIGVSPEGNWYLVKSDDSEGWIQEILDNEIEGDLKLVSVVDPACIISTDQARTVRVRVGYGENRTSVTMLKEDTEFEVKGQNTDSNDAVWYALDKEEAAPGKSINGDVAWVSGDEVEATGDCDDLPIVDATGIIKIMVAPTEVEEAPDTGTEETPAEVAPSAPRISGRLGNVHLSIGNNICNRTTIQLGYTVNVNFGAGHSDQAVVQNAVNLGTSAITFNGQAIPVQRSGVIFNEEQQNYGYETFGIWIPQEPGVYTAVAHHHTPSWPSESCTITVIE